MENHALYPTIALRVKIHDCDKCTQKLRKRLLRFDGVDWVDVEPKKELVTVIGKVDPRMLIEYLEGKKINAQLLYYEKKKKEQSKSSENDLKGKYRERDEKEKKNVGVGGGENGRRVKNTKPAKKELDDGHHVIEAYEAPKIDPALCRDPYCKLHKRRPIIHSNVPSIDSADHPHHTQGYSSFPAGATGRSQPFIFDGPFPYDDPNPMMEPPMLPKSSFGFHIPGTSWMPGFHNFGYYGDAANFRGGSYM